MRACSIHRQPLTSRLISLDLCRDSPGSCTVSWVARNKADAVSLEPAVSIFVSHLLDRSIPSNSPNLRRRATASEKCRSIHAPITAVGKSCSELGLARKDVHVRY